MNHKQVHPMFWWGPTRGDVTNCTLAMTESGTISFSMSVTASQFSDRCSRKKNNSVKKPRKLEISNNTKNKKRQR